MRIISGKSLVAVVLAAGMQCIACTTAGPGLFAKRSPHEQYGQRLTDVGLQESALGQKWFQAAAQGLAAPLAITLPYKETGYFASERPSAAGLRFAVKRGEKIFVTLEKKPLTGFAVFCEVWESAVAGGKPKLMIAGDTTNKPLELDIKEDGNYIVRIQPELLKSGEYTLVINAGPSLAFPIPTTVKHNIGSLWGVGRDNGARKHEGIDIFAPKHSAAIACADGVVTSVSENNLGGKVVFLRPNNKNYAVYYAHLDSQLVSTGETVRTGDTLGLTGNTGNARYTPSHLHFGIYASGGAVDPLPFVNPVIKQPAKVSASLVNLGKQVRSGSKSRLYSEPSSRTAPTASLDNTLLYVDAATAGWYKVVLPGGQNGYINSSDIHGLQAPLQRITIRSASPLLNEPDANAVTKTTIPAGRQLDVLAHYQNFYFVAGIDSLTGWVNKQSM